MRLKLLYWAPLLLSSFTLSVSAQYTIYPLPQQQISRDGKIQFTPSLNVICEDGVDQYTKDRLVEVLISRGFTPIFSDQVSSIYSNLYLGIQGSQAIADQMATSQAVDRELLMKPDKFDRHYINLDESGITVLGEHTNAVYFALASLEQILEQGNGGLFAKATLYDYADLQFRGVVEGYYGFPWTFEAKCDLMDFFKRYKMNTFVYGAKSDPYHSGYWEQDYPVSITDEQHKRGWMTQDMIRDLSKKSLETKVDFIWAIHPGMATAVNFSTANNTEAGATRVMKKFDHMYDLGVRQFSVFLDDCAWDLAYSDNYALFLTSIQNQLDDKYNKTYTQASDTVKPLHFVPSPYFIGSFSEADLTRYFGAIGTTDPKIVVYITGTGVWSPPHNDTFKRMERYLNRKAALWWNYPCNDNADSRIYMTDMYTTLSKMPASQARPATDFSSSLGIISNPMQQGTLSKITLFGVADYCWNTAAFSSKTNWEASLKAVVNKDMVHALSLFTEYGIYEDPTRLNTLYEKYKTGLITGKIDGTDIISEMDTIIWCCTKLRTLEESQTLSDQLLYTDMRPWINKLHDMAYAIKGFILLKESDEDETTRWNNYVALNRLVDSFPVSYDYVVKTLEGTGVSAPEADHRVRPAANYTTPFVGYLNDNCFHDFFKVNSIGTTTFYTNVTPAPTGSRILADASTDSYYLRTRAFNIAPGEYAGINFNQQQQLLDMIIAQEMFENYLVQYSPDGHQWIEFIQDEDTPDVHITHIRFVNKTTETRNITMNKDMFTYKLPNRGSVAKATVPTHEVYGGTVGNIFDGDYHSFLWLRAQANNDAYTLDMSTLTPIHDVRILFSNENPHDRPTTGRIQISADGSSWTNLRVKGRTATSFGKSNLIKYDDVVSYLDFECDGVEARYVRLLIATADTQRWLKLHEIEVNKQYIDGSVKGVATAKDGSKLVMLYDTKANTKYAPNDAGSLTYRFLQNMEMNEIVIYHDKEASVGQAPTIMVTQDNVNWTTVGELSGGLTKVDLTSYPQVKEMTIAWEGSNPPVIYEITEEGVDYKELVNSIENLDGQSDEVEISCTKNGAIEVYSDKGISEVALYQADGTVILNMQGSNGSRLYLPNVSRVRGVKILLVTLSDNKQVSYKLF